MTENPYLPPTAVVDDVTSLAVAPPLWNPNAAACWSLLLTPAFGAFLHMRNWQALGDADRARASLWWVIATLVLTIGSGVVLLMLPESKAMDSLSRAIGLGLLIGWYLGNGKQQVSLIAEKFGKTYPRKGWGLPLLLGVLAFAAVIVLFALVAYLVML